MEPISCREDDHDEKSILLMFHCEQDTGYAISSLESVFYEAAIGAGFVKESIFWSFKKLKCDTSLNVIEIDYEHPGDSLSISNFIKKNNIKLVLAFDMGFPCVIIPLLKKAGVSRIISYWGASMSGINYGLKLILKMVECKLRRNKPDLFIFESEAMRETATHGRGLSKSQTAVIYLGVDPDRFFPSYNAFPYTRQQFSIPENRKIIIYSGHMEERKGVRVIMKAAVQLVDKDQFEDVHFLICGNKNHEAEPFEALLEGTKARAHVTFAGYRNDMSSLMRGSHIGVIASTGWDSFTMSSVEMMASGLPLLVSDLQGLSETVADGVNGFLFQPGNHVELAGLVKLLAINEKMSGVFSQASRVRAKIKFSRRQQADSIAYCISNYL